MSESSNKSKWLVIALVASLALNVFAIGAIAARMAGWHHFERFNRMGFGAMADQMSDEGRSRLKSAMKAHRGEAGAVFGQIRESIERSREILKAPEFDAAAYAQALSDIRRHSDDAQAIIQKAFMEVVTELSPEDRAALAHANISPFHPPRRHDKARRD